MQTNSHHKWQCNVAEFCLKIVLQLYMFFQQIIVYHRVSAVITFRMLIQNLFADILSITSGSSSRQKNIADWHLLFTQVFCSNIMLNK